MKETTPQQILQEAREEFEKRFKMVSECQELCYKEETDLGANWKDLERTQLELRSFFDSTLQSFKEALMAELKEEITVSWDIADGGTEWVVQFWRQKTDGTKELFQQIDKKSDDVKKDFMAGKAM